MVKCDYKIFMNLPTSMTPKGKNMGVMGVGVGSQAPPPTPVFDFPNPGSLKAQANVFFPTEMPAAEDGAPGLLLDTDVCNNDTIDTRSAGPATCPSSLGRNFYQWPTSFGILPPTVEELDDVDIQQIHSDLSEFMLDENGVVVNVLTGFPLESSSESESSDSDNDDNGNDDKDFPTLSRSMSSSCMKERRAQRLERRSWRDVTQAPKPKLSVASERSSHSRVTPFPMPSITPSSEKLSMQIPSPDNSDNSMSDSSAQNFSVSSCFVTPETSDSSDECETSYPNARSSRSFSDDFASVSADAVPTHNTEYIRSRSCSADFSSPVPLPTVLTAQDSEHIRFLHNFARTNSLTDFHSELSRWLNNRHLKNRQVDCEPSSVSPDDILRHLDLN